jgi:Tol biopolymer transport system component
MTAAATLTGISSVSIALAGQPGRAAPVEIGAYELAYPFPSPDGASLAFQANFDGRWQLYAMETQSGAIRRLHRSDGDDTHPAFSPDGSRLAFISNRDGNDEVYVLELNSGAARPVAPHPGKDGHPKWSPDGQWLVFNRTFDPADREGDVDSAILRVRPDGASDPELVSDSPNIETFPSFSPDGRSVAFVEWFADEAGQPSRNGEIVVVELNSGARRILTRSPEFEAYPYWSPADDRIYFSSAMEGPSGREAVVQRIRPDGTGRERVTELDGNSDVRAVPGADGAMLHFNRSREGRTLLFRMPLPEPSESGGPSRTTRE